MRGIKSKSLLSWLKRLELVALFAFTLQSVAPNATPPSRSSDFAAFAAQSGLVDLLRPGQTVDLCSHSSSPDQQQTVHNSCPLCLVSGIPPGNAALLQPAVSFTHPVDMAATHQVCGQRTWPTELATGPPVGLSV